MHAVVELFGAALDLWGLYEQGLLPLALAFMVAVLLLSIAARRSEALRRALVLPVKLATASVALVPGLVLTYYSILLPAKNSRLEDVADYAAGTVASVKPEVAQREIGFVRVVRVELAGQSAPLLLEPYPTEVERELKPGHQVKLWYRNDDTDELHLLQLDVNGRRVLDWETTRPETGVFTFVLLPIGLLLLGLGLWMLRELFARSRQDDDLEDRRR